MDPSPLLGLGLGGVGDADWRPDELSVDADRPFTHGLLNPWKHPAMQLRVARQTGNLDAVVGFYRDRLGLPEIGRFEGHDGYDGVFLGVPATDAHLEFTFERGSLPPAPHPESLVVLYLGSWEKVHDAVARLGVGPVASSNPYWDRHGVTVADPDGFRVVLVAEQWSSS